MHHNTHWSIDTHLTRRAFLALTGAGAAGVAMRCSACGQPHDGRLPVSGVAHPALEPFDRLMTAFVEEHKVPGAALAVTRKGKLVYARGYGYADIGKKETVAPGALFRIASVSKPITGVAVMQLVEKARLKLDDKVTSRLHLAPFLAPGAEADPRWKQVTVRHCLQHTGGWDRDKSFDPISRPWKIAEALGIRPPVTPEHIVRYMMGQPLDFDPGARYAYSNLGYLVLGRIIEAVTGHTYETYVRKEVLGPLGIRNMQLGRALIEHRARGEVRYYDAQQRTGPALFPPRLGQQVSVQYGADNFDAYEAHGGWIASAVELVKFAAAFDDPATCPILGAAAIEDMWARPDGAAGTEADGTPKETFYGCGWSVRPVGTTGMLHAWHCGSIAGTEAILVRRCDGLTWAGLFNTCHGPDGRSLTQLIDGRLHEAADRVRVWPDTDQFGEFLK